MHVRLRRLVSGVVVAVPAEPALTSSNTSAASQAGSERRPEADTQGSTASARPPRTVIKIVLPARSSDRACDVSSLPEAHAPQASHISDVASTERPMVLSSGAEYAESSPASAGPAAPASVSSDGDMPGGLALDMRNPDANPPQDRLDGGGAAPAGMGSGPGGALASSAGAGAGAVVDAGVDADTASSRKRRRSLAAGGAAADGVLLADVGGRGANNRRRGSAGAATDADTGASGDDSAFANTPESPRETATARTSARFASRRQTHRLAGHPPLTSTHLDQLPQRSLKRPLLSRAAAYRSAANERQRPDAGDASPRAQQPGAAQSDSATRSSEPENDDASEPSSRKRLAAQAALAVVSGSASKRSAVPLPRSHSTTSIHAQHEQAAIASRLPPNTMTQDELDLFPHINHAALRSKYLRIRNWILAIWLYDPRSRLTLEQTLSLAEQLKHPALADEQMIACAFNYLDRRRFINFGVFSPEETPETDVDTDADSELAVSAAAHAARFATMPRTAPNTNPDPPRGRRPMIIIIGAGMAGLSAAREIFNIYDGIPGVPSPEIVILEGRNRLGGRILTLPLDTPPPNGGLPAGVDLAAQIVTGFKDGNPLDVVINTQIGAPVHFLNNAEECRLYDIDGLEVEPEPDTSAENFYNEILDLACRTVVENGEYVVLPLEQLESYKRSNTDRPSLSEAVSLGAVFEYHLQRHPLYPRLKPSHLRLLNWHVANLEYGNATNFSRLSSLHWDQDDEHEFSGTHAVLVGGYGQVPHAYAFGCASGHRRMNIEFGKTVRKVTARKQSQESPGLVFVECTDGSIYAADAVVVTLPLGVLKANSVTFSPQLPVWKTAAIRSLGMGLLNKVVLVFPFRFWNPDIDSFGALSDPDDAAFLTVPGAPPQKGTFSAYAPVRGRFFMFWNMYPTTKLPVLSAFVSGQAAVDMEAESNESLIESAMTILSRIFSDRAPLPMPIEALVTRWSQDEFARGSYSFVDTRATGADYDAMAAPCFDRVFWAGEATCRDFPATVHGALISGQRAASQVADLLLGPVTGPPAAAAGVASSSPSTGSATRGSSGAAPIEPPSKRRVEASCHWPGCSAIIDQHHSFVDHILEAHLPNGVQPMTKLDFRKLTAEGERTISEFLKAEVTAAQIAQQAQALAATRPGMPPLPNGGPYAASSRGGAPGLPGPALGTSSTVPRTFLPPMSTSQAQAPRGAAAAHDHQQRQYYNQQRPQVKMPRQPSRSSADWISARDYFFAEKRSEAIEFVQQSRDPNLTPQIVLQSWWTSLSHPERRIYLDLSCAGIFGADAPQRGPAAAQGGPGGTGASGSAALASQPWLASRPGAAPPLSLHASARLQPMSDRMRFGAPEAGGYASTSSSAPNRGNSSSSGMASSSGFAQSSHGSFNNKRPGSPTDYQRRTRPPVRSAGAATDASASAMSGDSRSVALDDPLPERELSANPTRHTQSRTRTAQRHHANAQQQASAPPPPVTGHASHAPVVQKPSSGSSGRPTPPMVSADPLPYPEADAATAGARYPYPYGHHYPYEQHSTPAPQVHRGAVSAGDAGAYPYEHHAFQPSDPWRRPHFESEGYQPIAHGNGSASRSSHMHATAQHAYGHHMHPFGPPAAHAYPPPPPTYGPPHATFAPPPPYYGVPYSGDGGRPVHPAPSASQSAPYVGFGARGGPPAFGHPYDHSFDPYFSHDRPDLGRYTDPHSAAPASSMPLTMTRPLSRSPDPRLAANPQEPQSFRGQNQSGLDGPGGQGDKKKDDKNKEKEKKKWEPPLPTRVGKKKKKGPESTSKLPAVFPTTRCKLKLLRNDRIKDYLLLEEEFVQNQERLKPQEEKNQAERSRVDDLRGTPMHVGSLEEIIDDDHAIVSTSSGTESYVSIMSFVDKDLLEPGCSVLLHYKIMAIVGVLQDDTDPMVSVMKLEKAPTESYADIGGLEQQIQEIKEAVELPLTHPELYEEMGIKPPKGVILYGVPGTGKTLLAKAVANQTSATFLRVVGSELIQKYLGDGPKLVRELFRVAEEYAPSIVFIDEIDAVGTKRYDSTSGGEREIQRTMLELLNQLDGFDSRGDVKVIMATNRIESLDPALIRPGRIDRKIEFPLPDVKTKRRIFNIHTSRMTLAPDVDLEEFVMAKDDLSGADIKAVCTEAGLLALRERRMKVMADDFRKAKEKVLYRKNEGTPEGLYL
ncbi:ATPase of 26S proteasome regulatory subunit 4 [Polyrhizophydium stewartii]|uniref:ATPase of 26S proteasome regulatory subunit 4 n=1 Tax=Polyrhizophydium stewartii TaxID=2732419 RepID=A0ABR4N9X0_9FUNG